MFGIKPLLTFSFDVQLVVHCDRWIVATLVWLAGDFLVISCFYSWWFLCPQPWINCLRHWRSIASIWYIITIIKLVTTTQNIWRVAILLILVLVTLLFNQHFCHKVEVPLSDLTDRGHFLSWDRRVPKKNKYVPLFAAGISCLIKAFCLFFLVEFMKGKEEFFL